MTNTIHTQAGPAKLKPAPATLLRDGSESLVDQLVRMVASRISEHLLRPGSRMPSIRDFAQSQGVSRFTVVEAYDRLVARGLLVSRRGSGFYVRDSQTLQSSHRPARDNLTQPAQLDVTWLVRSLFRQHPIQRMPGSGLLPSDWLDEELVAQASRSVARQNQSALLQYGEPQGFLPLRQQLALKMAELEISAQPEQIVLTSGVTQGLDLVARHFLKPGDTVFVDDPAWFLMFGSFVTHGARVIGIPRLSDGPDIARLAEMAALHKPKLFVINSILHNPSSHSLSVAKAFQVLKLAEQHNFMIVEDDIYCDLHPGSAVQAAMRISALDQLNRVIYLSGFSKSLAANLRVGYLACHPDLARTLTDCKMLSALTTPEIGERIVYRILSEGHYRKHTERLRERLREAREKAMRQLERIGVRTDSGAHAGMFVWADVGRDSDLLTETGLNQGILFAPGKLFSPGQMPSTKTRLNVACMIDPDIVPFIEKFMAGT